MFCTGPSDAWRDEYRRDMAVLKALINRPSVISTTTLEELGGQANKKPKVEVSLPQPSALAWESPVWAHVTSSSNQLLEADKGQQKGLQSLFGSSAQPQSAHRMCFMMCTPGPQSVAVI